MEKRYYWLQLKEDFFDDEQIDYLKEKEMGSEYIYVYLRLCFLAANNGGVVERRIGPMVIPYTYEKLASVINSDATMVEETICYCKEAGLIEDTENGAFRLVRIAEMVGSESAFASQKRRQRERNKANGTPVQQDEANEKDTKVDKSETMSAECPQNVHRDVHTDNRDKRLEIRDREREEEKDGERLAPKRKKPFSISKAIDDLPYTPDLKEALKGWAEMRKEQKSPVTERGLTLGLEELRKLGGDSPPTMLAIVNQSIFRGWKGFFPLKESPPMASTASGSDRREQMKQAVEKGGW